MSMKYKLNAILKHPGYNGGGGGGGGGTPAPKYAPAFSGPSVSALPTAPSMPQYSPPTSYGSNLAGMSQYTFNPYGGGGYGSPFGGYGAHSGGYGSPFGGGYGSPFGGGYGSPFGYQPQYQPQYRPQYQAQYQPQSQPQGPVGRSAAYDAAMASGDPRQIHMAHLMKGASSSQPQPQSQPQGPVGGLIGETVRLSDLPQYQPQYPSKTSLMGDIESLRNSMSAQDWMADSRNPLQAKPVSYPTQPQQMLDSAMNQYTQYGNAMNQYGQDRAAYDTRYNAYKQDVEKYNSAAQDYRNAYSSGYVGYNAPQNYALMPYQQLPWLYARGGLASLKKRIDDINDA